MDNLIKELMNQYGMSYEQALEYVLSLPKYEVIDNPNCHHNREGV